MPFSLRVVIADDDRAIRNSLKQLLYGLGHEVVAEAENGESLIERCAIMQPDVVITGNLTPRLDGSAAAAVIYKCRQIPIILFSVDCNPNLARNAQPKYIFMHLLAPIFKEHLRAALKDFKSAKEIDPFVGGITTIRFGSAQNGQIDIHQS